LFVPNTIDVRSLQQLFVTNNLTKNVQTSIRDAMDWKKRLKHVPYAWLVVDKLRQSKEVIVPLSPLSMHSESRD
jgi:hypothetical protein